MRDNSKKLFSVFSLKFSTYIRYALLVILMYGSFVAISLYIPYLVKGTIQNLIFWFFLLAIFDQIFIKIENFILNDNDKFSVEFDSNKEIRIEHSTEIP